MRRLPFAVALIALVLALLAAGGAAWVILREARAAAGREVAGAVALVKANPAVVPSLEAFRAVQSARVHDAAGKLVIEYHRPPANYGLAARLAPPEVTCETGNVGQPLRLSPTTGQPERLSYVATVCIESSPGAVAPAVRGALMLLSVAPPAAAILGLLLGQLLARRVDARLRRVADVVEKATHDRSWSLRVDDADGELGRITTSINDLLAQTQERDTAIRRHTLQLEAANKDLESFAYSVSHDLRAPLGSIDGFTQALEMDYGDQFDATAREYFTWIRAACTQMRELIDGLLQMARLAKHEVQRETIDLSAIARSIADSLTQTNPARAVKFVIRDGVRASGDERLLRAVLENLMANAWKFTRKRDEGRIEFGVAGDAFYVRDNGAGFDPTHAAKMFRPFQRLHSTREFEGTGIGLATVQKIIERHGGRAWAEGEVEKGATIYFTTA